MSLNAVRLPFQDMTQLEIGVRHEIGYNETAVIQSSGIKLIRPALVIYENTLSNISLF